MATFSVTNTFVANTRARAADVNQNFTDVLTILRSHHHDPNIYTNASPITNSGIAANAQILDTQLFSPITRSGLINDSSIQRVTVPKGGTGLLHVNTGDMIYASSSNVFSTIPVGVPNQVLALNSSSVPTWTAVAVSKFGGTGSDGALSISSGTTTIDCANAAVVIKNYTSISITGTGTLAFSNPNTNGTVIILKSQGAVTLTSSSTPMINAAGMGGAGGTGGTNATPTTAGSQGGNGNTNFGITVITAGGAGGGASGANNGAAGIAGVRPTTQFITSAYFGRTLNVMVGAGGGGGGSGQSGGSNGANGGRGGGGLIIECAGAWNFTTSAGISVAGSNGSNAGGINAGGGGGGGAGFAFILYGTLTANSGTITVTGGTGGTAGGAGGQPNGGGGGGGASQINAGTDGTSAVGGGVGGNGGAGWSLVTANVDFT